MQLENKFLNFYIFILMINRSSWDVRLFSCFDFMSLNVTKVNYKFTKFAINPIHFKENIKNGNIDFKKTL